MSDSFKRAVNKLIEHNRCMKYFKKIMPNIPYKRLLEVVKLRHQVFKSITKWNGETKYWDKRFLKEKKEK